MVSQDNVHLVISCSIPNYPKIQQLQTTGIYYLTVSEIRNTRMLKRLRVVVQGLPSGCSLAVSWGCSHVQAQLWLEYAFAVTHRGVGNLLCSMMATGQRSPYLATCASS